ncbi:MAG: hypothetical protein V4596_09015 [Bdellovibrionota bacterium]
MKFLNFILVMSIVAVSLAPKKAVADESIRVKLFQSLKSSRNTVEREISKGKNSVVISEGIINYNITPKHKIKVNLEFVGDGMAKWIDARLVVYLNNDNGGMILDVNNILSPETKIASKTTYKSNNEVITKMYIPINIFSPEGMAIRLGALAAYAKNGKLGSLHLTRDHVE